MLNSLGRLSYISDRFKLSFRAIIYSFFFLLDLIFKPYHGKIPFIKYVLVKNIKKKRKVKIPKSKFIKDINLLTKSNDIKIVVELIGGSDGLAKKLVFSALNNGKHVITANKALMESMVINYEK